VKNNKSNEGTITAFTTALFHQQLAKTSTANTMASVDFNVK
jgi:hypothetical protein